MKFNSRPSSNRWVRAALTSPAILGLALFLTACNQQEWDRFIEGLLMAFAMMLIVVLVLTCASLLYFAACVTITIYNFAKPNRFTMIGAWILGGSTR